MCACSSLLSFPCLSTVFPEDFTEQNWLARRCVCLIWSSSLRDLASVFCVKVCVSVFSVVDSIFPKSKILLRKVLITIWMDIHTHMHTKRGARFRFHETCSSKCTLLSNVLQPSTGTVKTCLYEGNKLKTRFIRSVCLSYLCGYALLSF